MSHIREPSPVTTQSLLLAAADHNIPALTSLLKKIPSVNHCLDPETNRSALHVAIDSLPDSPTPEALTAAGETLQLLLNHGAIWNDLDANNETPGCIAFRRGFTPLYDIMVAAGVRAEILLSRLGGWDRISSNGSEPDEAAEHTPAAAEPTVAVADNTLADDPHNPSGADLAHTTPATAADSTPSAVPVAPEPFDVTSKAYLASALRASDAALVDADNNGVMMKWETNIMAESVRALGVAPGKRVLNVGFGMGIFDGMVQDALAGGGEHVIVEAHPEVLERMRKDGWFERRNVRVLQGRWQEAVQTLVAEGAEFDAVYFDTFAEGYAELKMFFSEVVVALLEQEKGRFGFFHGLGADRRVCWDVYTKVLEMDLWEAGLECTWKEVESRAEEEEWNGVRHRYWNVGPVYRLPICEFMR